MVDRMIKMYTGTQVHRCSRYTVHSTQHTAGVQGNFFSCACTHALQVSFNISWYVVQMHRLLCAGKIYVNINTVVDTISKSTCKVSSCTVGSWKPVVYDMYSQYITTLFLFLVSDFEVPKSYANIIQYAPGGMVLLSTQNTRCLLAKNSKYHKTQTTKTFYFYFYFY